MRFGIFGGTFNPIHNGHVELAKAFMKALSLDQLIIIPTYNPPHKEAPELIDGQHRINMCNIAISDISGLSVSDMEIVRGGRSFTVDTVNEYKKANSDAEIFLIIGADMFTTMHKWWRFGVLKDLCTFCAAPRHQGEYEELLKYSIFLKEDFEAKSQVFDFPVFDISSTEIREKIGNGEDISMLVPFGVKKYIYENGLYMDLTLLENYRTMLKGRLTEERYNHCLGVEKEAVKLALHYNADPMKARIAGLLHDITKDTSKENQLQICAKYGIMLDNVELGTVKLWHAITGAAVLENEIGIKDKDIINAVRYHTTARANMSLLEKIIYIADFISEDRTFSGVEQLRETAYSGIDEVMKQALDFSIKEVIHKNSQIHLDTVSARNELVRS